MKNFELDANEVIEKLLHEHSRVTKENVIMKLQLEKMIKENERLADELNEIEIAKGQD